MGPLDPPRLLITGATGFLGRAVVNAALDAGHAVTAVARTAAALENAPWRGRAGITGVVIDLASSGAREALDSALAEVDCVVHTAMASGAVDHATSTVAATDTLIGAITARREPPFILLISSLSVYNYASMPTDRQIDETTPLEPEPHMRDAYCRAKLAQEALARRAAQRAGLRVTVLRPGAIVGPGRLRTSRLGFGLGPLLVMPGGAAPIPLIGVDQCAALILRATWSVPSQNDIPILSGSGAFAVINLVDRDQPTQRDYARHLASQGWPHLTLRIPLRLARLPAIFLWFAGVLLPSFARSVPGALRLESFDARFKPLCYSTARAEDRLGLDSPRTAEQIAQEASSAYGRS